MRFRLLKLDPPTRPRALALGTACLFVLGAACSGEAFTSGNGPSASGSGGTGQAGDVSVSEAGESGSNEGGSGGLPGESGAGAPPSAGSAGKPGTSCDCAAGEYCQDGTNKCRKCADFSRFEFGSAQKLSTLAQGIERFARPAAAGSALFYVSGAADSSKILYAASPLSGVGTPVTAPMQVESGPLLVDFAGHNLFFDRRQPGGRKLRMAVWTAPALLTNDVLVPEPINSVGSDDYSIAISPNTGHVYWMSTRNGSAELLVQATSMTPPPAPAVLELKVKAGTAECARSGDDATPWVNLAGTLLLFSNPSLNENCEANDSGASDLFAAPLDKDGAPLAAATALASLNHTGGVSRETDPSLSSDACYIYFASDNGMEDFDLYKAQRN